MKPQQSCLPHEFSNCRAVLAQRYATCRCSCGGILFGVFQDRWQNMCARVRVTHAEGKRVAILNGYHHHQSLQA